MLRAARLVGNDVVDLDDPHNRASGRSARFVARVTSPDEQARLAEAPEPHALLWTLFAAKEAAFKVVAKLTPGAPFAHRRFRVAPGLDRVEYGALALHLWVTRGDGFVHAVVSPDAEPPPVAWARVDSRADAGRSARSLLCAMLAERFACDGAELAVVRAPAPGSWDGFGPPRVARRGVPLALDVSLSHEGRFVAAAVAG